MTLLYIFSLFFSTALVTFFATWFILNILKRRGMFDTPNERSSHMKPTPRGGGLAIILVSLGAWGFSLDGTLNAHQGLFIATLLLVIISWIDDVQSLPAWVRLISQFLAVALVFGRCPHQIHIFKGFFHNG